MKVLDQQHLMTMRCGQCYTLMSPLPALRLSCMDLWSAMTLQGGTPVLDGIPDQFSHSCAAAVMGQARVRCCMRSWLSDQARACRGWESPCKTAMPVLEGVTSHFSHSRIAAVMGCSDLTACWCLRVAL